VIDPVKHLKLKGSASWVGCVALDASESWLVRAYLLLYNFFALPPYYWTTHANLVKEI